ncbi:CHAT domain-containing protein [Streptomyces sp. SKN60]|uniref:CHAT domain-containing tetratricopeptide repeat protein n=1 Tax=Streptomyces sp. SKN60 TaxID=2855506 RepID=UPI0022486828|nr:CHAT domain-containing protein [Streptomyces sp. SKN60]
MVSAADATAAGGPGGTRPSGDHLLLRHLRTGDRDALDEAIRSYRRELAATEPGDPTVPGRAGNLLIALHRRWQLTLDAGDLGALVAFGHERVSVDPVRPQDVVILALTYRRCFDLHGRASDLDRAVELFDRAAGLPQDATTGAQTLAALGEALQERHDNGARGGAGGGVEARGTAPGSADEATDGTADGTDLARATSALRDALEILPPGSPDRPGYRNNLATALHSTYLHSGDTAALREALDQWRTALRESPPGSEVRPLVLANLSQGLRSRHDHDTDEAHRAEMLEVHRTALAESRAGHPKHPARLAGLAVALRLAAEDNGDPGLLRESAELLREALPLCDAGAPERAMGMNSLGNTLHRLAQSTGDATVLDEAIAVLRSALAQQRPGTGPYADTLANLAVTLRERGLQTDDLDSLREATRLARTALDAAPASPAAQAARLANLGVVLQSWHGATGDPAAADEAVDTARRALALAPRTGAVRADRLNHLANALRGRFGGPADGTAPETVAPGIADPDVTNPERAHRDVADLDEAAALLEEAAGHIPYGDPALALVLSNLGSTRLTKHHHSPREGLLAQAVSDLGRAVWSAPEGDPAHGTYLHTYGDALRALHHQDGDPAVLRAAEDAYRQAAGTRTLPAYERVLAAWDWGAAAAAGLRWSEALRGHEAALELLPFAASGRLARSDQERGLSRVRGLAAEAAACAVNAGRPEHAVSLLEQGRGVLLSRAMDTRDGIGRLRGAHPGLAERFVSIRDRLDALEAVDAAEAALGRLPPATADQRHTLASRLEELVAEIRRAPGFADFLGAPDENALLACAEDGPVVLAYCSGYRSDALVLRPEGVLLVPLPRATPDAVGAQADRLRRALADAMDPARDKAAQRTVAEVLAWTWDHVTGPVLDRLGLSGAPGAGAGGGAGGELPRLWWSPGGTLAALPLHAAGHHDDSSGVVPQGTGGPGPGGPGPAPRTVMDRVVSSYTPTVRALRYARDRAAAPCPAGRLLAVALPDTPGARPLGGARREAETLRALLPTDVLYGEEATFDRVMAALPDHPCVHFACHGVSEPAAPSAGRLLVHDHSTRPLTVRQIARLDLPAARLVVLSACETARADGHLADESIHITSAFQLAGYPHAVGTLWPVHDAVAVRVTRLLYRRLRTDGDGDGGPALDDSRTAAALHLAVRECRAAFAASPSLWAAHIHAGA